MIIKLAEHESRQIRTDILDAAELRIRTYGYGKTTMVEIATDAGMSAANLYRYFDSKLDIGAALAQQCFSERFALLQAITDRQDLSAAQKLEAFVIENLRYTHNQFSKYPKVNELVDIIITERADLIRTKIENDRGLVKLILQSGIQNGEFYFDNLETTSQTILHAIVKFSVPLFISMHPLDEFEQYARDLVALLVKGLKSTQ